MVSALLGSTVLADDTSSIDNIIDAYYEVISGPVGFVYDSDRDEKIHAQDAQVTKFFLDGTVQQHDFKTEQASIVSPYETPFFEFEVDRRVEQFGNIATFGVNLRLRAKPRAMLMVLVSTASRCFIDDRWWISSWSTQYKEPATDSTESKSNQLADLNTEEFREVVKSIVQDTLQACEVQGGMEGRAKMNLAVVGEVKAKLVCDTE